MSSASPPYLRKTQSVLIFYLKNLDRQDNGEVVCMPAADSCETAKKYNGKTAVVYQNGCISPLLCRYSFILLLFRRS